MHFVRGDAEQRATEHIASVINRKLSDGMRVLWLVSGGSAVGVAVRVRQKLASTTKLTVMQVDERYGPVGHSDSNWQQLLDKGFVTSGIKCRPILLGKDFAKTTLEYNRALTIAYFVADFAIGLFGIGSDGHTAGILPGSSAVSNTNLVASFQAVDYQRITITPTAIAKLDLAVAYVADHEKFNTLQDLQAELPIFKQPAQALKLAKEAYVYNEHMEGMI
ncbi:MAG TPA: 6-phosphogluconolactonase [Patescibacteria group bacterium]|jgi:6-phosphogluconolactonase/glucosamine-6-phosphate isomerase/deaminase|nr:6-phosphogluconolactonase [Patescibacteria group bacterium]